MAYSLRPIMHGRLRRFRSPLVTFGCLLVAMTVSAVEPVQWSTAGEIGPQGRQAVLIAADRYVTAAYDIPFAATNLDTIAAALTTTAGIAAGAVHRLSGAQVHRDGIRESILRAAAAAAGEDAVLIVYFTGHGFVDSSGEAHFFTHFTREAAEGGFSNVIARSELTAWTAEARQQAAARGVTLRTTIIADACRTRTMAPPPRATFRSAQEWELYSTAEGRFAEAPSGAEASPFTRALAESMQALSLLGGSADVERVFAEASRRTRQATADRQIPELLRPRGEATPPHLVMAGLVDASIQVLDALAEVAVAGAEVRLDGRVLTAQAGLLALRASPGPHRVQVEAAGYLGLDTVVELGSSHSGRRLDLRLQPARIVIRGSVDPPIALTASVRGVRGTLRPGLHVRAASTDALGRFQLSVPDLADDAVVLIGTTEISVGPERIQRLRDGPHTGVGLVDLGVIRAEPIADAGVPPVPAPPPGPAAPPQAPLQAHPPPAAPTATTVAWASTGSDEHGSWAQLVVKGVDYRFRWIPPGRAELGLPAGLAHPGAQAARQVLRRDGLWMLETELTQRQWLSVIVDNPFAIKGGILPAHHLSWDDTQRFVEAFRSASGLGSAVRLPREEEWEYACRAGAPGLFNPERPIDEIGWTLSAGRGRPMPVGRLAPNAWGLRDLHGNVAEWVEDGGATANERVFRGGSFRSDGLFASAIARRVASSTTVFDDVGFRLVIAP